MVCANSLANIRDSRQLVVVVAEVHGAASRIGNLQQHDSLCVVGQGQRTTRRIGHRRQDAVGVPERGPIAIEIVLGSQLACLIGGEEAMVCSAEEDVAPVVKCRRSVSYSTECR